ncbi:N-6 DNA methylase, partial [Xanthomonas citri pv. citri]
LYHLNDKGRAYLILPIGWLFKGGYDLAVREALVHHNLIESVTLLPLGILQYSQANVCLVVLNTAKTTDAFWLMTAENIQVNRKYGGEIAEQSIAKIIDFIKNPTENNVAVKVTQAQIAQYKYDLNPKCYFKDPLEIATLELTTELTALADYQRQYEAAKVQLDKLLSSIAKQS